MAGFWCAALDAAIVDIRNRLADRTEGAAYAACRIRSAAGSWPARMTGDGLIAITWRKPLLSRHRGRAQHRHRGQNRLRQWRSAVPGVRFTCHSG
jgi:hypothetical protein